MNPITAKSNRLPTQYELPYSDDESMESDRHVTQIMLLVEPLRRLWAARPDAFVGADMFLHYRVDETGGTAFRGPDVLVAQGVVPNRERLSWVVWEEGKPPDVVIELLSERTRSVDKGAKKRAYCHDARVPEYIWFDPFRPDDLAGFRITAGRYQPIDPDANGGLQTALGLGLVRWPGTYHGRNGVWLRWSLPDGTLVPTPDDSLDVAHHQAEAARHEADAARHQAEAARHEADAARHQAERDRLRCEALEQRLRALGIDPHDA